MLISLTLRLKANAKLQIDKVTSIAQALNVDPKALMSMVLDEYMPSTWSEIQRVYGISAR